MKPVFCFLKPEIGPKFIYIEESRWKDILNNKINDISYSYDIKKYIRKLWDTLTRK